MNDSNNVLQLLKSRGQRATRVRTALLTLLFDHSMPLSVAQIMNSVPANKTTIYREMDFLKSQGIIQEIDFGDGKKRYEIISDSHHHHVVCNNCGTIEDVVLEDDIAKEEKIIARLTNFQVQNHSLEFFGLCPNCQ